VRQVGYLSELYEDARPEKYKIQHMCFFGGEQKGPVARRHVETELIEMQAVVRSLGEWLGRDEDKERGKQFPFCAISRDRHG